MTMTEKSMKRESLLKEVKKDFPERYNIAADFIGDLLFSDKPIWETYETYFDYDLYDCNSAAPFKRWAYDVCTILNDCSTDDCCSEYDDEDDYEDYDSITVAELVKILKKFNQDAKVRVSNGKVDVFDFAVADDDDGVIIAF